MTFLWHLHYLQAPHSLQEFGLMSSVVAVQRLVYRDLFGRCNKMLMWCSVYTEGHASLMDSSWPGTYTALLREWQHTHVMWWWVYIEWTSWRECQSDGQWKGVYQSVKVSISPLLCDKRQRHLCFCVCDYFLVCSVVMLPVFMLHVNILSYVGTEKPV